MAEPKDGVTLDTATDNYDNWTWKQIKLAICGDFAVGADALADATAGVSDPMSLFTAAVAYGGAQGHLVTVQTGLETLKKSVTDTWKGKGAKGFTAMLDKFKSTVDTLLDSLRGVGAPSYTKSLSNASTDLATAIYEINQTDDWGSGEAIRRFYDEHYIGTDDGEDYFDAQPPWSIQPDGTMIVAVSTYPDIVDEMNRRMRASINKLGNNYKTYNGDLRDPGNPNFDTGGDAPNDPPDIKVNVPEIKIPPPPKINAPPPPNFGANPPGGPGGAPPFGSPGGAPPFGSPGGDLKFGSPDGAPPFGSPGGDLKFGSPGGLDGHNLPQALFTGSPPPGGPGSLPPLPGGPGQAGPTDQLPPLHHTPPPPNTQFDPLTHLSGLNSPNASNLANGLHLPTDGLSGANGGAGALASGLRGPDGSIFRTPTLGGPGGLAGAGGLASGFLPGGAYAGGRGGAGLAAGGVAGGLGGAGRGLAGAGGGVGGSAGGGGMGMPYMPMGGMGGRGGGRGEERERNTWLEEDEDVWGTTPDVGPAFLDGSTNEE
jgi:uncharacterized protein YukE